MTAHWCTLAILRYMKKFGLRLEAGVVWFRENTPDATTQCLVLRCALRQRCRQGCDSTFSKVRALHKQLMQGIDYCHARRCISWPPEYRNASSPCAWWTKMAVSNVLRHGTICRCSRFLMNFLMNFLLGGSFTETWSQHPSGPCETAWLFRYSCCTTKTLHTFGETLWETVLYFRVFVPRFSYSATPLPIAAHVSWGLKTFWWMARNGWNLSSPFAVPPMYDVCFF